MSAVTHRARVLRWRTWGLQSADLGIGVWMEENHWSISPSWVSQTQYPMVQGLQWTVLLGVQVSTIPASNGFQIYTVSLVRLQWYKKEWWNIQTCTSQVWQSWLQLWRIGQLRATRLLQSAASIFIISSFLSLSIKFVKIIIIAIFTNLFLTNWAQNRIRFLESIS